MGVTVQTSLWIAVGSIVTSEVPNDQSLVSRSREEHVGAAVTLASPARQLQRIALFERGSQAGDPAAVALKGTTVDELLSHDGQTRRSGELHESCCDGAVVLHNEFEGEFHDAACPHGNPNFHLRHFLLLVRSREFGHVIYNFYFG